MRLAGQRSRDRGIPTVDFTREPMGGLRSLTAGGRGSQLLVDRGFDYRADGTLRRETDRVAGREQRYELDAMGRIVQRDQSAAGSSGG